MGKEKILPSVATKILHLRNTMGLSYDKIAKRVGVSSSTVYEYVTKYNKENSIPKIIKTQVTKNPPKSSYFSGREYDFLQNIRFILDWAVENSGLKIGDIELLLYLYPKGIFSKQEFYKYKRTFYGRDVPSALKVFIDNKFIVRWKEKKENKHDYYVLTQKSKIMLRKMHKMAIFEEDISTSNSNKLLYGKNNKSKYYKELIQDINKERKKRGN